MRSMVEGWLPRSPRLWRDTAKACAGYPSTPLRGVPLPMLRMGRQTTPG